jgi:signal transduction histidine kinase
VALVAYIAWLFVLFGFLRRAGATDPVLTAWLGIGVAYWLIEEAFDQPRVFARRVAAFLSRYGGQAKPDNAPQDSQEDEGTRDPKEARRDTQVINLKRLLAASPRSIPSDLHRTIARVATEYSKAARARGETEKAEAAEAEAFGLLTDIRNGLRRMRDRDRPLVTECLSLQRGLTADGLRSLVTQSTHHMRKEERMLLLRELLLRPPKAEENLGDDTWITQTTWNHLRPGRESAGPCVRLAESTRHDVIKHGLPRLDRIRERLLRPERDATIPPEDRVVLDAFLDRLAGNLRQLDESVGPGLCGEELAVALTLRRTHEWVRVTHRMLEELVATTRRLLERLTAQLWVVVPDLVEALAQEHESGGVPIDVDYDPARRTGLAAVAELQLMRSLVDNLLRNAVAAARAASDERTPQVRVVVALGGDPRHPLVEVRVEDSGHGLAPTELAGAGSSTTHGLDLVRDHLAAVQGELQVGESLLGGAKLVLRIPCMPD